MKKLHLTLIALLGAMGSLSYALTPSGEVTETTDEAKIAAIEQHAQELQAKQNDLSNQYPPTAAGAKHHKRAGRHHGKGTHKPAATGKTGGAAVDNPAGTDATGGGTGTNK